MSRTPLTVYPVVRTALRATPVPVAGDVANGNIITNDGATFLELTNADGANTHTCTVQVASGVDGLTAGPRTYTLPISAAVQKTGVFPVAAYGPTLLINVDNANVKVNAFTLIGP